MAVIVPGKGESKQVAKRLLELAEDPNEVATTMEGPDSISFIIPDDLYDAYMDADDEASTDVPAAQVVDEETVPAPKRRGRPPGSKNKPKTAETEE